MKKYFLRVTAVFLVFALMVNAPLVPAAQGAAFTPSSAAETGSSLFQQNALAERNAYATHVISEDDAGRRLPEPVLRSSRNPPQSSSGQSWRKILSFPKQVLKTVAIACVVLQSSIAPGLSSPLPGMENAIGAAQTQGTDQAKEMAAIVEQLKSKDSYEQYKGLWALKSIIDASRTLELVLFKDAVPPLLTILKTDIYSNDAELAIKLLVQILQSYPVKSQKPPFLNEIVTALLGRIQYKDILVYGDVVDPLAEIVRTMGQKSWDPELRRKIIMDTFYAAMKAKSPGSRIEFFTNFEGIYDLSSVPIFIGMLKEPDETLVNSALEALNIMAFGNRGEKGTNRDIFKDAIPLLTPLHKLNKVARYEAVSLMGKIGDAQSIPIIMGELKGSSSAETRSNVLYALRLIELFNRDNPQKKALFRPFIPDLVPLLKDRAVNLEVAILLHDLGWEPSSTEEKAWLTVLFRPEDAVALGASAIGPLTQEILRGDWGTRGAPKALADIAKSLPDKSQVPLLFKDTIPALVVALKEHSNDSFSEEETAWALGEIAVANPDKSQNPKLFKTAVTALLEQIPKMRYAEPFTTALGKIGDPGAIPDLVKLVLKHREFVASAALQAIKTIGGEAGRKALEDLSKNDTDKKTREDAAQALGELNKQLDKEKNAKPSTSLLFPLHFHSQPADHRRLTRLASLSA